MKKITLGLALFGTIVPLSLMPPVQASKAFPLQGTPAKARIQAITCDASIATSNGTLLYKITGSIELNAAGQQLPPTQDRSNLQMTVQRRDRQGNIKTLLTRAPLRYFERIGPDADYSQLPFSAAFRGKPNDGRGLYSTPSTHTIYTSLRPATTIPQQIQIIHYLSSGKFVRSMPGRCQTRN